MTLAFARNVPPLLVILACGAKVAYSVSAENSVLEGVSPRTVQPGPFGGGNCEG
jgi:hypothetical protein